MYYGFKNFETFEWNLIKLTCHIFCISTASISKKKYLVYADLNKIIKEIARDLKSFKSN